MEGEVTELDRLRNAALAGCGTHTAKSSRNERSKLVVQVQDVTDTMPVLTKLISSKLAERVKERVRNAVMSSICGKIAHQGDLATDDMIAYAKTQKMDAYYNLPCVHLSKARKGSRVPKTTNQYMILIRRNTSPFDPSSEFTTSGVYV